MGCSSCGVNGKKGPDGKPLGCKGNGGCTSGGCNRLNVFDWLSDLPFSAQQSDCRIVEVSFKNGSRKGFYRNTYNIDCHTGDLIVVESPQGHDIGNISLSGELVRLQMQKKKVKDDDQILQVMRMATAQDLQRLDEVKKQEFGAMLLARVIANQLDLDMKISDVEYQGDGRKATFYYTADSRVDFRELIKLFAKEFRVKIEMRQIGARQEASRIGGIGSCGRELCCSTWLTSFKSVSTTAARYQNLAINQSKLSGQCGRLKCCLNYELDTYLDALQDFPKSADHLTIKNGTARLVKTDIFRRKMWYSPSGSNNSYGLTIEQVKEILAMNARGEKPESLAQWVIIDQDLLLPSMGLEEEGLKDIGNATLAELEKDREKRRRKKRKRRTRTGDHTGVQPKQDQKNTTTTPKGTGNPKRAVVIKKDASTTPKPKPQPNRRNRNRNKNVDAAAPTNNQRKPLTSKTNTPAQKKELDNSNTTRPKSRNNNPNSPNAKQKPAAKTTVVKRDNIQKKTPTTPGTGSKPNPKQPNANRANRPKTTDANKKKGTPPNPKARPNLKARPRSNSKATPPNKPNTPNKPAPKKEDPPQ